MTTANIQSFRHIRLLAALFFLLAATAATAADTYFVRGIVRDSITDEVLPFASVVAMGSNRGGVSDAQGIFELSVPVGTKALQVSCMGYDKKVFPIKRNSFNMYAVYLSPSTTELQEVVVHKLSLIHI